ncbi:glutamate synthase subunit beta [Clostridium intestinale]|jgi:glutamate synthase (NADPH/NADH) small chain|uniref:Glutamate synthase subunit beta n=1 Tax=Clostridium intestinale TaxID=36845 RepID=A0A7D6VQ09_9CLOT|nr:glutamate synthase subunit beta [Clostridium intestinale]QLY80196.1 glutamate synthase subunit beta [Clostridium intestinale]
MGKPTGFLEFEREEGKNIDPIERLEGFEEFHKLLPKEQQEKQGARCMDCGIPFCQSGILINGMVSGCPINNLIPEWNDLIYRGKWKLALKRLLKTNNFPEFTGRVCPAPCEAACTAGINGPAITIKENERSIIDRAFEEGLIKPEPPKVRSGKKVAVIGSGPAGLATADSLNKRGHNVVVFERHDRIGGLLMYGIPNMKLDKSVIDRRVNLMKEEGVEFVTNANVGDDYRAEDILNNFDAVVLATGASNPRDLKAPGRELNGIHFAVDFLRANTKSLLDSNLSDGNFISAKGKNVIVIGGGDTGTDCVGTSLRHGCESLVQFEIMNKPPLERADNNPWPQWPRILKVDYGQQEFEAKYGEDPRKYAINVKSFEGDSEGNLTKVNTVDVKWEKNDKGAFVPVEVPGSEKEWKAELVLLAMGFLGTQDYVSNAFGVDLDARTNVKAGYGNFRTNVDKVFAAGDSRRGQSLVVWAINEGRAVAKEVDSYLAE